MEKIPGELYVLCNLCIERHDGEDTDDTLKRLQKILDSELCNLADHHVSYQIEEVFCHNFEGSGY